MASQWFVKVSGAFKEVNEAFVKVSGNWKEIQEYQMDISSVANNNIKKLVKCIVNNLNSLDS